jgi:regulatory protein
MAKMITALKVQKKNHQRLNVHLDGEFAFGLSRFTAAWLQVGQELTEEDITALLSEDEIESAYQKSLKYIGFRMRTTSEVGQHLRKKGINPEVIEHVIERLIDKNFLNDEIFASQWIDNRNEFRPRSHRMLALELRRKGIKSEIIQEVIENTQPEDELAYLAAKKRIRRYEHLDWQNFQRKLGSHLARRGFSYSTIKPVVHKVWSENNPEG